MTPKTKVLVVDDDPDILLLLRAVLETNGFSVALAGDGETALHRIDEEHPDLVLLDVMMPLLDGWAVLERLKDQPRPRIVMLTAKTTDWDRAKGYGLGADEYVNKPFDPETLLNVIREVLRRDPEEQERLTEMRSIYEP